MPTRASPVTVKTASPSVWIYDKVIFLDRASCLLCGSEDGTELKRLRKERRGEEKIMSLKIDSTLFFQTSARDRRGCERQTER
jgi:hypothetical protein